MKKWLICLVMGGTLLGSCRDKERSEITDIIEKWMGKEIILPKYPVFTRFAKDTVSFSYDESEYKILNYVDSIGCTVCNLNLLLWDEFIQEVDSVANKDVSFLFFYNTKNIASVHFALYNDGFSHPICIDEDGEINRLNKFPIDIIFQTFLLDKNNKVVAIGNPIHNRDIAKLYIEIINKNKRH